MTTVCKTCRHNCNPKGKNKKPPLIANNSHAICWCNAEGGRLITKKYKQCKFYEQDDTKEIIERR